jgi:hypothetical protein
LDGGFRQELAIRHKAHGNVTAALLDAEKDGLAVAVLTALFVTADESLVHFNGLERSAHGFVTVHNHHILADFVAHAPRGLIGHPDLALDLLGGNAVAGRAEQKHHMEPIAQAGTSLVKGHASGRVKLVAAKLAAIGTALGDPVELRILPALLTIVTLAKARQL